jgi:hypothetical protein
MSVSLTLLLGAEKVRFWHLCLHMTWPCPSRGGQSVTEGAGSKREGGVRAFDLLPQQDENILSIFPTPSLFTQSESFLAHLVHQAIPIANTGHRELPSDNMNRPTMLPAALARTPHLAMFYPSIEVLDQLIV